MLATIIANMRILTIVLSLLLFNSCLREKVIDKKRINKFEYLLGKQESKYLNEIITDFDLYLDTNYDNNNEQDRFKSYLIDFIEKQEYYLFESDKPFTIDSAKLTKYKSSKLFNKYFLEYPVSVWKDSTGRINIYYRSYHDTLPAITNHFKKQEEQIEELKNTTIRNYTSISPFYTSLDSVKERDSLITIYLWSREGAGAGRLSPIVLADGILHYLNDSSEYFGKRIFIMGLYDY